MRDLLLRRVEEPAEIAACFTLMRELRPHFEDQPQFFSQVRRQLEDGYRLLAACAGEDIVGLAGFRVQENLVHGRFIYVDDLVVAASQRRNGVGTRLLDAVSDECRKLAIPTLILDTALSNSLGQRFYFRYGMLSRAMRFTMAVVP